LRKEGTRARRRRESTAPKGSDIISKGGNMGKRPGMEKGKKERGGLKW